MRRVICAIKLKSDGLRFPICEILNLEIYDVPCITVANLFDIAKSCKMDSMLIANVCMFNETPILYFVVSANV